MSEHHVAELFGGLPVDVVVADVDRMEKYRRDRADDPAAGMPLAVVRAETTEHVQCAVQWAARHGVPVVPRGAGTGLSGGANAIDGCLVVTTERMQRAHVDVGARVAIAQAGALNADVKRAVAQHGLWYPPDPSSFEICSIGGNVATNAGGLCCVKYGVTGDYVLGMEVVVADGRAIRLGGPRVKDVAGLSLAKLFVGSEGTLGIITEVTLRLLPAPRPSSTFVAWFDSADAATAAVLAITAQLRPAMLEYMDRVAIAAVEDTLHMGLDTSAAALLIGGCDRADNAELTDMMTLCERHGGRDVLGTEDPDEGEAFRAARRAAIPAVERRGRLLLEDVGVPLPRLPDLVRGIAQIATENDLSIPIVAHAGDGNTHPLIVFDPTNVEMTLRADRAFDRVMRLAIELDGTITGEHGVGRLKLPWLADQVGAEVLDVCAAVKRALDPAGILNSGCAVVDSAVRQT